VYRHEKPREPLADENGYWGLLRLGNGERNCQDAMLQFGHYIFGDGSSGEIDSPSEFSGGSLANRENTPYILTVDSRGRFDLTRYGK